MRGPPTGETTTHWEGGRAQTARQAQLPDSFPPSRCVGAPDAAEPAINRLLRDVRRRGLKQQEEIVTVLSAWKRLKLPGPNKRQAMYDSSHDARQISLDSNFIPRSLLASKRILTTGAKGSQPSSANRHNLTSTLHYILWSTSEATVCAGLGSRTF